MSGVNITEVRLLKTHLENDYLHTMYFDNASDQQNFFKSRTVKTYTDFSYQRKDEFIRVPSHYDDVIGCNYVMYKNSGSSNKWYYAFITDMKYVNDERTDVFIETDVMQTWLFDYQVKSSFVEREHVSDDTIGLHTIPEDLNVGQIVCDYSTSSSLNGTSGWYWFVIACNYDPISSTKYAGVGLYGDYPQGSSWFAFPIYPLSNNNGIKEVSDWVHKVVSDGMDGFIQSMFALPWGIIDPDKVGDDHRLTSDAVKKYTSTKTLKKSQLNWFKDYTPKNNKLYCYPYSFLRVTNNSGSFNDYKIEDFKEYDAEQQLTDNVSFKTYATACIGVSGKVIPVSYQGISENDDESIPLGKYPTLSWSSDAYTNWLTQNAVNMGIGVATGISGGAAGGFAIGGPAGAVVGGVLGGLTSITSAIGGMYQASMLPNTAQGNANAGDVNFNHERNHISYYKMRAKKEYLKVIDDFFSMYGYKINQVKIPNKKHRSNWWYTKTIDVNIDGNIPINDLRKIKACYNNGITFWRDSNIGDYSKANTIL